MSKLIIGTVQFGLDYGVTNHAGQVPYNEVQKVLKVASLNHINMIDTAVAYGDSEGVLGRVGVEAFKIVTKLPELQFDKLDVHKCVVNTFSASLERLNVSKVYGLLLHCPSQLLTDRGAALYKTLLSLKKAGLVEKIGVSIYQPEELDALFQAYDFDLVQVPFNIIDRRLMNSGWFSKLQQKGVEIHARSVFLQGLLLMSCQSRPDKFGQWNHLWKQWDEWLQGNHLTPLEACIRYALSIPEISNVIVGVDSSAQLSGIITALEGELPIIPPSMFSDDRHLLNPAKWNDL